MKLVEAYARLRAVHAELGAARFSVDLTQRVVRRDPSVLFSTEPRVRPVHLRSCAANLGLTYIVRLFAEFETVVCDYLSVVRPRRRPRRTGMEVLLNRIAAMRIIPPHIVQGVHDVREYRNELLHFRLRVRPMTFEQCMARLNRFLRYLPPHW